jgi:PII-like signaling protein
MQIPRDAVLLRIFFGESDRFGQKPLYEAVVLKARELKLAGAASASRTNGLRPLKQTAHCQGIATFVRPSNGR